MTNPDDDALVDIDGYLIILRAMLRSWSRAQRLAFAAALSERWLGVYENFSTANGWGHPEQLRDALDDVWAHIQGQNFPASAWKKHSQAIMENTPDLDEFDAWDALTSCMILDLTLEGCGEASAEEASDLAERVAVAAYDAVAQDETCDANDPEYKKRTWRQPAVQREIGQQMRVFQAVYWLPQSNASQVDALRKNIAAGRV